MACTTSVLMAACRPDGHRTSTRSVASARSYTAPPGGTFTWGERHGQSPAEREGYGMPGYRRQTRAQGGLVEKFDLFTSAHLRQSVIFSRS